MTLDRDKIIYGIDTHMKPEENSRLASLLKIHFEAYRKPVGE
jgi:hypothetical protein